MHGTRCSPMGSRRCISYSDAKKMKSEKPILYLLTRGMGVSGMTGWIFALITGLESRASGVGLLLFSGVWAAKYNNRLHCVGLICCFLDGSRKACRSRHLAFLFS